MNKLFIIDFSKQKKKKKQISFWVLRKIYIKIIYRNTIYRLSIKPTRPVFYFRKTRKKLLCEKCFK